MEDSKEKIASGIFGGKKLCPFVSNSVAPLPKFKVPKDLLAPSPTIIEMQNEALLEKLAKIEEALQPTQKPQRPEIPKGLESYIRKAIAEGFIDPTTYAWTESGALFGYFVKLCAEEAKLYDTRGRIKWKSFSFISNLDDITDGAKTAVSDSQLPKKADIINTFFEKRKKSKTFVSSNLTR